MSTKVYADNAATTVLSPKALDAMRPFFDEKYGNPSGIYRLGREAKRALNDARETIASAIGAEGREIYFTSGGSEADNWAIKGIADMRIHQGKHMISTSVEHHAVLNTMNYLGKKGFDITYLPVDKYGQISLEDLRTSIRKDTILISVMAANNEVGTIYPIEQIGQIAKEHQICFHVDGVQAAGRLPLDMKRMNIDLLSISAHKFHGPKGTGALAVRKGIQLEPLIHGGGQERGVRGGTENTAGIAGMAAAIEEAYLDLEEKNRALRKLTTKLINGVLKLPAAELTGDPVNRLPGTASFVFSGYDGKELIHSLDLKGITCSSGSACDSGSLDPSHVLLAMGIPHRDAQGALRLSLSSENTEEQVDYILETLEEICTRKGD